jgi:8-oxo-dGTP pyrophosphatase MutT (NUDIX family)
MTVAAIIEREGKFLLVEEISNGETVINQPAGHLENNEDLITAVIRETLEETARAFTPALITGFYQWRSPRDGKTFLRICFSGHCGSRDPERSLDKDILRTLWLSRDELLNAPLRSPLVLLGIDDYLAGKHYPLELLTRVNSE